MNEAVEPCPTCPEGWRPIDKEHCADCYEGRIERLRKALQNIADQMLTDEMGIEVRESGDFEGAYDIMIGVARKALGVFHS